MLSAAPRVPWLVVVVTAILALPLIGITAYFAVGVQHLVARAELKAGHARPQRNLYPEVAGGAGQRVGGDVRVYVTVLRHPDTTMQRLRAGVGQALEHFFGPEQLGLETERSRAAGGALQIAPRVRTGGQPDTAR